MTSKLAMACILLLASAMSCSSQAVTASADTSPLITGVLELVKSIVQQLITGVQNLMPMLGSAGQELKTKVTDLTTKLNNTVTAAVSNTTATVQDQLKNIQQAATDASSEFNSAVQKLPALTQGLLSPFKILFESLAKLLSINISISAGSKPAA